MTTVLLVKHADGFSGRLQLIKTALEGRRVEFIGPVEKELDTIILALVKSRVKIVIFPDCTGEARKTAASLRGYFENLLNLRLVVCTSNPTQCPGLLSEFNTVLLEDASGQAHRPNGVFRLSSREEVIRAVLDR